MKWSDAFIAEMRHDCEKNREKALRATVCQGDPIPLSHEGEIMRRANLYAESGNPDYLVDVAKYAMWVWIAERELRESIKHICDPHGEPHPPRAASAMPGVPA